MKKHIEVTCNFCFIHETFEIITSIDGKVIYKVTEKNADSIQCDDWTLDVTKHGISKIDFAIILKKLMNKIQEVGSIKSMNSCSFTIKENVDVVDNNLLSFAYRVDGDTALLSISALGISRNFRLHKGKDGKWVFSEDFTMLYELKSFALTTNMKDSLIMNCLVESLNDFNDRQVSPFFFIHELYE